MTKTKHMYAALVGTLLTIIPIIVLWGYFAFQPMEKANTFNSLHVAATAMWPLAAVFITHLYMTKNNYVFYETFNLIKPKDKRMWWILGSILLVLGGFTAQVLEGLHFNVSGFASGSELSMSILPIFSMIIFNLLVYTGYVVAWAGYILFHAKRGMGAVLGTLFTAVFATVWMIFPYLLAMKVSGIPGNIVGLALIIIVVGVFTSVILTSVTDFIGAGLAFLVMFQTMVTAHPFLTGANLIMNPIGYFHSVITLAIYYLIALIAIVAVMFVINRRNLRSEDKAIEDLEGEEKSEGDDSVETRTEEPVAVVAEDEAVEEELVVAEDEAVEPVEEVTKSETIEEPVAVVAEDEAVEEEPVVSEDEAVEPVEEVTKSETIEEPVAVVAEDETIEEPVVTEDEAVAPVEEVTKSETVTEDKDSEESDKDRDLIEEIVENPDVLSDMDRIIGTARPIGRKYL